MRNLKRALSLTLASVMLLGMMVIGTSAASYPDVDQEDNVEAIEVLQAVGVMQGDDKGNFDPDREVSRNEMAIIMAKLLNLDYNYYSESCPFWDVPDYAKPYVGACYANGIVSGYNANTYGGADTVTAVQAASMMMRALGYFQYDSDYKDGFVISTVRQASKIGLFKDINAGQDTALTRNQVAQLALNTLESAMVDANDNTLNISGSSGDMTMSVSGGQVDYVVRTSTEQFAYSVNAADSGSTTTDGRGGSVVQLGEQLYRGDLKKDSFYYDQGGRIVIHSSITDEFQRPATRWTYKVNEIGTYANIPDYSYTTSIDGDTPADKVKNMGLKGYKWDGEYYENGAKAATLTGADDAERLGKLAKDVCDNGVLVEVFMDKTDTDEIKQVTVTRTQMMQVASVNDKEVTLKKLSEDRSENTDNGGKVSMGSKHPSSFVTVKVVKADDDGFAVLKDLQVDDYVLIVPVVDGSGYKVASAVVPETVSGVITNVYTKSGDRKIKAVSVDGNRYSMSYAWTSEDDQLQNNANLSNKQTSQVFLDTYGNAIYVKDVIASNAVIIIDQAYQSLVDGRLTTFVDGWDTNGNEVTLNLGTDQAAALRTAEDGNTPTSIQGKVYEYTTTTDNKADYKLVAWNTTATPSGLVYAPIQQQWIKNGQFDADVLATGSNTIPMATNVKFIFLSIDSNGNDVTGITIRDGISAVGEDKVSNGTYDSGDTLKPISYVLNKDKNKVIAVVVADDADAAVTENLIFITENNEHWVDNGQTKTAFEAYDAEGKLLDGGNSKLNKNVFDQSLNNKFFTYTQDANGVYSIHEYTRTDRITSVSSARAGYAAIVHIEGRTAVTDDGYFRGVGSDFDATTFDPDHPSVSYQLVNARNATVIDLVTDDDVITNSTTDIANALKDGKATGFDVAYIFNGSDNIGRNTISTMFVLATYKGSTSGGGGTIVTPGGGTEFGPVVAAASLNTALVTGNATITGDYVASTAGAVINIPTGRTLTIQGNLDYDKNYFSCAGTGKVVVTGTTTLKDPDTTAGNGTLNCNLESQNVVLDAADSFTYNGPLTVGTDMTVNGAAAKTITFNGAVTVGRNVVMTGDNAVTLQVKGTTTLTNGTQNGTGTGNLIIEVLSANSLYVRGTVASRTEIKVGDASNEGYAEIAALEGKVTVVKAPAAKTPKVETVKANAVVEAKAGTKVEVATAEKDSKLIAAESNANITVTQALATKKVSLGASNTGSIVLDKGVEVKEDGQKLIAVEGGGTISSTGDKTVTLQTGAAGGAVNNTEGGSGTVTVPEEDVTVSKTVSEVKITNAAKTIKQEGTLAMTATVTSTGSTDKALTWTITGAKAAKTGFGDVSNDARVKTVDSTATGTGFPTLTVDAAEPAGTVLTITATSKVDSTKSSTYTVTVLTKPVENSEYSSKVTALNSGSGGFLMQGLKSALSSLPSGVQNDMADGAHVIIAFKPTAASGEAVLSIKNASGAEVFNEKTTIDSDSAKIYYVSLEGKNATQDYKSGAWVSTGDTGTWTPVGQVAAAGIYTYTVTMGGTTITSGNFEVTAGA